jgi:hypothetical protein
MAKTIGQMMNEVRECNIAKGWRPADGGPGENTFGDYIALLHSEIGEATDAYRKHRLADATQLQSDLVRKGGEYDFLVAGKDYQLPKPEGVGAELADVLIRLLSTADAWEMLNVRDLQLDTVPDVAPERPFVSFGDRMAWLHEKVAAMRNGVVLTAWAALRALLTVTRGIGIDLDAEYKRKMAHNWTRPTHHGGTMADPVPARPRAELAPHVRLNNLRDAMPTDERGWWIGPEIDTFPNAWHRLGLPEVTMIDGQGNTVLFWCRDVRRAAALIGMADHVTDDDSFDIRRGEYTASIVQADDKE